MILFHGWNHGHASISCFRNQDLEDIYWLIKTLGIDLVIQFTGNNADSIGGVIFKRLRIAKCAASQKLVCLFLGNHSYIIMVVIPDQMVLNPSNRVIYPISNPEYAIQHNSTIDVAITGEAVPAFPFRFKVSCFRNDDGVNLKGVFNGFPVDFFPRSCAVIVSTELIAAIVVIDHHVALCQIKVGHLLIVADHIYLLPCKNCHLVGEGSTILLQENVNYGTVTIGELKDVTIKGSENSTMRFVTDKDTKIENVTVKDMAFEFVTGENQKNGAFVVIDAAAQINNLVVENCNIVGDGKKNSYGIVGQNTSASIVVRNCNFSNLGYAIQTIAGGGYESLLVENCSFDNMNSWVIMPQYGYSGDLTINGCTFNQCSDGLVKTGAFNGSTFTFTNNTITASAGHDGKDSKWFEVNASASTKVVEGNTKDGAAWTPDAANGLK
mgnify:CR=1 FL=1